MPDIHARKKPGGEDRRTLDAVKKFASDQKFDEVVFLGDVIDHSSISSHNIGNLRAISGETVFKDYEHTNKMLDEIDQATRGAKKIVIQGNHEYRADRLINAQPQLAGLIESNIGMKLKERGWRWVPYWTTGKTYDIGRASFGHGKYVGQHHAYKHAVRYGRNFYYGHLHDMQSHTVERDGDDLKYEAASLGCLCEYRQSYLEGAPTRWQQAITTFRFLPNGAYNAFPIRIFNHRFVSPEGKVYKG